MNNNENKTRLIAFGNSYLQTDFCWSTSTASPLYYQYINSSLILSPAVKNIDTVISQGSNLVDRAPYFLLWLWKRTQLERFITFREFVLIQGVWEYEMLNSWIKCLSILQNCHLLNAIRYWALLHCAWSKSLSSNYSHIFWVTRTEEQKKNYSSSWELACHARAKKSIAYNYIHMNSNPICFLLEKYIANLSTGNIYLLIYLLGVDKIKHNGYIWCLTRFLVKQNYIQVQMDKNISMPKVLPVSSTK